MVFKKLKYIGPERGDIYQGDIFNCTLHTASGRVYVNCDKGIIPYSSLKELLEEWSEVN